MELKYQFMLYAGIILVLAFGFFYFFGKKKQMEFRDGKKLAAVNLIEEEPYYKKRKIAYKVASTLMVLSLMTAALACCVLLARPYKSRKITEQKYSRDIMLCIDISTSVDFLNKNVIKELMQTVENLKTERFGIIIFNTSPVLISPLTDDYEYTIEQLQKIEKALDMRLSTDGIFNHIPDDYLYYNEFISGGTLVGNEERGSSLIGDGMASSIFQFSDKDTERTKVVIFTTDNDPQGESLVSLSQAAQLCEKHDIVVYGVGTKEMLYDNLVEMKQAVETTGGSFYLEEESGSFESIIEDIEKKSTNLVEGNQYVVETEYPFAPFIVLLISTACMFVCMKYSKR